LRADRQPRLLSEGSRRRVHPLARAHTVCNRWQGAALMPEKLICAAPDDGASPAGDSLDGEVAARIFLSTLDRGIAHPDELMVTFRDLLASRGRAIPPSHYLRGFCRVIQQRMEGTQ